MVKRVRSRALGLLGLAAIVYSCGGSDDKVNARHDASGGDPSDAGEPSAGTPPSEQQQGGTGGMPTVVRPVGGGGAEPDVTMGGAGGAPVMVEVGGAGGVAGAGGADDGVPHCLGIPAETLGYWTLDAIANGKVADSGPQNVSGDVTGATVVAGKIGNALDFDGSAYVTLDNVKLQPADAVSLVAWAKPSAFAGGVLYNSVVGIGDVSGFRDPYWMGYFHGAFEMYTTSGTTDPFIDDMITHGDHIGSWHHLVATYHRNTGHMALYVDGALTAQDTIATDGLFYTGAPLRIGTDTNGAQLSNFFSGSIDEVKIFSCRLTEVQVARDFDQNWPFAN